jgi:hypothetical protein
MSFYNLSDHYSGVSNGRADKGKTSVLINFADTLLLVITDSILFTRLLDLNADEDTQNNPLKIGPSLLLVHATMDIHPQATELFLHGFLNVTLYFGF